MRQHLPEWLRALTAEPGSRDADFDWGEWAADTFREMRGQWLGYAIMVGVLTSMFSCASTQMDAQIEASAREKPKVDPWALDKPAGETR